MELGLKGRISGSCSGVLTATVAVFSFLVFSSYSQNLVQNGSFEAGGGSFEDWQISHSISQSSYDGPTISGPGFNNSDYACFKPETEGEDILSQPIATTPGDVYDISFGAEDGAGHNFCAEFNFGSFSYNLLPAFATGPAEWYSGWMNFSFDVTAAALETDLSFAIEADMGSEFGLDDINVVAVPEVDCAIVGRNINVTVTSTTSLTVIEASTNLLNWAPVYTNTAPFTFTDSASQFPLRFYRAAVIVK